jgi:hypothetical protein
MTLVELSGTKRESLKDKITELKTNRTEISETCVKA